MGLSLRGLVVLAAACGSDPAMPDAMPDAAPRCDSSAPFATPVPLDNLNTMLDDVTARLTPDELTIVFARKQMTNVYDLYQATRDARDVPFGAPSLLGTVNSVNSDLWPTLSPDGLTLMFDSDRGMPGALRIHVAKRAATSDPFGTAVAVTALMTRDSNPSLANARALYFNSAIRTGLGVGDIWRAEVSADGTVGQPAAVIGGVNSVDDETAAALTDDELRIYFRRTIGTEEDIYTAARSTVNDGFGAATAVPGLSVAGVGEVPSWVTADGCNLYLFGNLPGNLGGRDLYVARRGEP